jgi:hypothetical protein
LADIWAAFGTAELAHIVALSLTVSFAATAVAAVVGLPAGAALAICRFPAAGCCLRPAGHGRVCIGRPPSSFFSFSIASNLAGLSPGMTIRLSKAFGRSPENWLQRRNAATSVNFASRVRCGCVTNPAFYLIEATIQLLFKVTQISAIPTPILIWGEIV